MGLIPPFYDRTRYKRRRTDPQNHKREDCANGYGFSAFIHKSTIFKQRTSMTLGFQYVRNTSQAQRPSCAPLASFTFARKRNRLPYSSFRLEVLKSRSRTLKPNSFNPCNSVRAETPLWSLSCHNQSEENMASSLSIFPSAFPPFSCLSNSARARKQLRSPGGASG